MFDFKISKKQQSLLAASFTLMSALYVTPASAVVDPVILTFSTVGDSRQDPLKPDPSLKKTDMIGVGNCQVPYAISNGATPPVYNNTGTTPNPGLSGQDCKWLQNSTALSRIMRTIQAQKSQLLFFNGEMIMG